jgi:tRNA threonylcarbamoyladenosine biosynthesis protein TsaE|tara:strand:- start:1013 stop:1468 length:456 start_codon:yes stop_codon:yes gene_type:complete
MPTAISSDKINLSSEKQTEELANKFTKKLKPGNVVFLYGEMGVGKTTFIRYLINKFQKDNKLEITEVTSPTFNLLNQYQINQIKIDHYDLFRLKSVEETKNLDLFEDNTNTVTLIEWPQIIKEKPNNLIELNFEYEKDHQSRFVQIKGINL